MLPPRKIELAARAIARWGRIDVWVNNAGVTTFSRLEHGSFDEHRRVIETNLYGAIYGARAVLPTFRQQRRGELINVGSVLSSIGQPFVPSYVISKFALRGLTEALRAELAHQSGIFVCPLHPRLRAVACITSCRQNQPTLRRPPCVRWERRRLDSRSIG